MSEPMPEMGHRILGVGVDAPIGEKSQGALRKAGLRATVITVTDDEAGDAILRDELAAADYDAVVLGAGISGQAPSRFAATPESTVWFNRLLNLVHAGALRAKIVLARGPEDVLPAIERELGES